MEKKQESADSTVTLVTMPTSEGTYWGLLITGCGSVAAQGGPFRDDAQVRDWAKDVPLAACSHDKPEGGCLRAGTVKRELGKGAVFRLAGLSTELDHGLFGLGMVLGRLMLCGCPACGKARKVAHSMLSPAKPLPPPPPGQKRPQN